MAVNEKDWLKHQMSGKQYWTVIADYPEGERSYPFPTFLASQKFAESSSKHPQISNVRIKQPTGGEIKVDSTHKHVVVWSGEAKEYKAQESCPINC